MKNCGRRIGEKLLTRTGEKLLTRTGEKLLTRTGEKSVGIRPLRV